MAFLLLIKCNNFLLKHVTLLGLQLRCSINDPKFVFFAVKNCSRKINASLFAQHNSHGQPVVGSLVGLYHSLSRISNLINPVFAHHPQGCRVKQIEGGWRSISRRRKLHSTICRFYFELNYQHLSFSRVSSFLLNSALRDRNFGRLS